MRVKFKDLYDMYPNKWVLTVNDEWKNGDVDTCEVDGVYDTQDEAIASFHEKRAKDKERYKEIGISKMVKEEDALGFIFILTNEI